LAKWQPLAKQKSVGAQYNLGRLYSDDQAKPPDYAKAIHWLTTAAEQGHTAAKESIRWLHPNAGKFPESYAASVEWHSEAAQQGLPEALLSLSALYSSDKSVPRDDVKAIMWKLLHNKFNHKWKFVLHSSEQFTPARLTSAKKLAQAWFNKYLQKTTARSLTQEI